MTSRKSSSKRRVSVGPPSATVTSNSIVECSEEMSDIIKRIMVVTDYIDLFKCFVPGHS